MGLVGKKEWEAESNAGGFVHMLHSSRGGKDFWDAVPRRWVCCMSMETHPSCRVSTCAVYSFAKGITIT